MRAQARNVAVCENASCYDTLVPCSNEKNEARDINDYSWNRLYAAATAKMRAAICRAMFAMYASINITSKRPLAVNPSMFFVFQPVMPQPAPIPWRWQTSYIC